MARQLSAWDKLFLQPKGPGWDKWLANQIKGGVDAGKALGSQAIRTIPHSVAGTWLGNTFDPGSYLYQRDAKGALVEDPRGGGRPVTQRQYKLQGQDHFRQSQINQRQGFEREVEKIDTAVKKNNIQQLKDVEKNDVSSVPKTISPDDKAQNLAGVKISPVEKFAWEKQAAGKGSVARNKAMLKQWQGVEPTKAATTAAQSTAAKSLTDLAWKPGMPDLLGKASVLNTMSPEQLAQSAELGQKIWGAKGAAGATSTVDPKGSFSSGGTKGGMSKASAVGMVANVLSSLTDKSEAGWTPNNQLMAGVRDPNETPGIV